MAAFIFLSIYLLVPFLTAYFYKKSNRKIHIIFTYILVGFLIFMYPFGIFQIQEWLNPPIPDEPRCGMPEVSFFICNCIIMIPITQVLLLLFHLLFKNKTKST